MIRKRTLYAMVGVACMLASAVAAPGDETTLKAIMQGLRVNLHDVADGLLTDDFELIARGASGIAEHPRIPAAQVQLVAAELGQEMAAFKHFDARVHDVSLEIRTAAERFDRQAVVAGYQEIIAGCLGCHDAYKNRVAAVLGTASNGRRQE